VQNKVTTVAHIFMPPLEEYTPKLKASNGGGGGGDNSPTPAGAGHLPKSALKQFTPPTELLNNMHPRLAMEPTIIAPPDAVVPTSPLPNIGDPSSHFAFLSNGPGSNGGIGDGDRGGVGNKKGRGYGPGDGDAGIFVAGRSGVSFPQVISSPSLNTQKRHARRSIRAW
jgi:hypothetical protein